MYFNAFLKPLLKIAINKTVLKKHYNSDGKYNGP